MHVEYDSEDDTLEDLYDGEDDADAEAEMDDDPLNMAPGEGADDATEDGDDDSPSDDSDEEEEEEEDEDDEDEDEPSLDLGLTEEPPPPASEQASSPARRSPSTPPPAPSTSRNRSLSPARIRRNALTFVLDRAPRSYTVEAICAIPHPVPTHALASSSCMTHLLTGSDDGYIRDYDIFSAVNSKNFLTAPQRHHAAVVEGLMKSGQLRCWWENPSSPPELPKLTAEEESGLAPVYSLAMQSDALWALAGTDSGAINLFTLRHEPGRLCHVMTGHNRTAISALCLDYDEKGFFSAGWDGVATQWDLNTGQNIRSFTAHNAQLTSVAVRPIASTYAQMPAVATNSTRQPVAQENADRNHPGLDGMNVDAVPDATDTTRPPLMEDGGSSISQHQPIDSDARSDASFDPLFDDVPEESLPASSRSETKLAMPGSSNSQQTQTTSRGISTTIPPPKGAPPLFDPASYSNSSPELLLTAFIDGQVILWDRRVQSHGRGVGRLWMSEKTPPWCLSACWSADGGQIYAGRRNGTVDVWDVRVLGQSGPANTPRLLKTLRNPTSSGVVSCVVAFPDARHIACASVDNIRLWNVAESAEDSWSKTKSAVQFKIIPGHHGGYISQMLIDSGARFLVSASSNRGLHGDSTKTVFVHDIKHLEH